MGPAAILSVLVDADTGGATANLKRFDRQVRSTGTSSTRAATNIERMTPALRRMGSSAGDASRGIGKLAPGLSLATRIPVYKFAAIGSAIQAVVPPVVALTSALAPLTGLLGALPGLASAAAQGIGTIALGAKGIGDAIKAAMDVQTTAVKDAGVSLQAHRAAAEQVRSAIRSVGDAERDLSDAQDQSKRAQEDLSTARREATRELVDMRLAAQGAALSEKEARLELTQAIEAQAEVLADEQASALDAREAELSVQRARLGLREATVTSKRSQDDYNESQRKGIKGSDQVVSAQDALHDAQRRVADSQRSLVDATRAVRLAQVEQTESLAKNSAHVDKLKQSMAALPPAARDFARFIIAMKPRLDSLRAAAAAGIFPSLEKGITAATRNFGVFHDILAETADAIGQLGEAAGRRLGSAEWGRDIQIQGERNIVTINRLGRGTLSLAEGFRHIMLAAGPLVSFLTSSAERFSAIFASWAKGARESGKLDAFFQRTIRTTKLVVEAFWDFGRALINVGKIADRVWGQDLLRGINNVAERFRDWTESVRGQRAIEGYFVRWRKRWEDIAQAVGRVIGEYFRLRREGRASADAFVHTFADTLARLIPAIANRLGQAAPQIVSGFVRGFLAANAWGKIAIGGWLIAKFGGLAAFGAVGRRIGAVLGLGIASGAEAAVAKSGAAAAASGAAAGGGMFAVQHARERAAGGAAAGAGAGAVAGRLKSGLTKLGPAVRTVGKGVLAFQLLSGIADGITRQGIKGIGDRFQQAASTFSFGLLPAPKTIDERLQAIAAKIRTWKDGKLKLSDPNDPDNSLIRQKDLDDFTGRQRKMLTGLANLRNAATELFGKDFKLNARMEFNPEAASKRLRMLENEFGRLRSGAVLDVRELRKVATNNFRLIAETMGVNSKQGQAAVAKNFNLAVGNIIDFKKRGVINAAQAGDQIATLMKTTTGRGKDALAQNMLAAQRAIARTMTKSGKITEQGLGLIRSMMVDFMRGIGLSSDTIRMSLNKRESAKKGFTQPGQTGLVVRGGKPHGDSVHALLERGEVVINRKAVQKMGGPHAVDRINKEIPRFQQGGPVGLRRGGRAERSDVAQPNFGGHPSNVSGGVAKLIGVMQGKFPGLLVTSTTDHSKYTTSGNISDHYSGHAVDLASGDYGYMNKAAAWVRRSGLYRQISQGIHNPNLAIANGEVQQPPGQYAGHTWTEHANHIHLAIAGMLDAAGLGGGAAAAAKLARLNVSGGGAMGQLVEGGLNKVRAGAQRKLNRLAARVSGVGRETAMGTRVGPLPAPGIASRQQMAKWATKALHATGHGASPDAIEKILTLAQKESGWNTHSINLWDSNAAAGNPSVGLMQVTIDKMGMHWPEDQDNPRLWDPVANMIASINYQFGRYGGLITHSPYAKGGVVGYAGDSLGVGTIGPLRGLLDRKVEGHPSSGKTSGWGVGQLIKGAAQHVFDFGTNDATGSAIRSSINTVDRITGKKPVHVMTVNGTPQGGQSVDLKNKAIRNAAGGDVRLVDWAAKHKGQLDALGHGAYPERARLIAESIRRATGAEGRAGDKDGGDPKVGKPFRGPLGKTLKKTLASLRHITGAKGRGKRLRQWEKRIRRDLGLPTRLQHQMSLLSAAAELYGERADNAASLNVENEDGTTTLGILGGKDQGGWLNEQLGVLLTWRNKILDAKAIIEARHQQAKELLERARKRLKALKEQIGDIIKRQAERREQLKELRKKPKINKEKIEQLRDLIGRSQDRLEGAKREELGLRTSIEPGLKARISTLIGEKGLGALSENLVQLQGISGPMNKIVGVPPIGEIPGGDIFNVQLALRDLATKPTPKAKDDSDLVALLKQLLTEANLRTAVSERHFDIFKNFDATSGAGAGAFMGAFAKGGVALVGENGPELAHLPSGTRIHSASDTASMVAPQFDIHINGDIINVPRGKDPVEIVTGDPRFARAVEDATRRIARNANRRLAGGGGGR